MKNTTLIPVLDMKQCVPDTDFHIKQFATAQVPPDMMIPHRNSSYKISLLLEGEVACFTDFKEYKAKAPALLFLSPEQVHQRTSNTYHKMVQISFNKDFLLNESQGILSCWDCMFGQVIIPVQDNARLQELQTYANLLLNEFKQGQLQRDLVIRNLLNAFIIASARLTTCETRIVQMDGTQNKTVRQFKDLTDEHFLNRTQVSQYADMLYITPGHLNDLIKNVTGRTAKQIIDEKRIVEAKRLLFWGQHSVKEIAGHLNFEDDAYFNRFFKKHTGRTPASFQKTIREKYN